jgi:hypothetical protein
MPLSNRVRSKEHFRDHFCEYLFQICPKGIRLNKKRRHFRKIHKLLKPFSLTLAIKLAKQTHGIDKRVNMRIKIDKKGR